jgi:L-alanine-DL-glutamate epimerase-like enolase superfamily enzyme
MGTECGMLVRQAMKVTSIDTAVLHVPCPRPMSLEFKDHRMVAAFIDTDEGVRGFGYTLAFGGGGAEAIQVYLETRLKPLLIGEDPRMVGKLWEKMFRADRGIRRVGLAGYGVAALDIALWDLVGKIAGQPLFRMWGAVTDRVEAYGSGGWANYAVDDIIAEGRFYAGHGCRYYKMKIHDPDPRKNVARVEAVKKALGDGVRLMVDVNQKLDVLATIKQA